MLNSFKILLIYLYLNFSIFCVKLSKRINIGTVIISFLILYDIFLQLEMSAHQVSLKP